MTTNFLKSPKAIAGVATALLFFALFGFMTQYKVNHELQGSLNEQKLHSENLLSQKLALEKDLKKFKTDVHELRGANAELDKQLTSSLARITAREAELKKLQQQNASLANYRKQYEAVAKLKKELDRAVEDLTSQLALAQIENRNLSHMLAELEKQNAHLQLELNRVMVASLDQPRVETLKGRRDKLTVVARKTNKMKVNVEIPANLRDVSFQIKDQSGQIINKANGSVAYREVEDHSGATASASSSIVVEKPVRKIEMIYNADKKLRPGIYTVEILSEKMYVGSVQVKLK